jgi:hypothetical protein
MVREYLSFIRDLGKTYFQLTLFFMMETLDKPSKRYQQHLRFGDTFFKWKDKNYNIILLEKKKIKFVHMWRRECIFPPSVVVIW